MEPCVAWRSPAIASRSSFCPLPAIPAIPKISPLYAMNPTSSSFVTPSLSRQVRPAIVRRGFGFTGSGRSILRETLCPTIISVSSVSFVSGVLTVAMCSPFLRTATTSEISITSFSLCVIMMIAFPSSRIVLSTEKSFLVSCGVRTAVGSSRMSMSAPL